MALMGGARGRTNNKRKGTVAVYNKEMLLNVCKEVIIMISLNLCLSLLLIMHTNFEISIASNYQKLLSLYFYIIDQFILRPIRNVGYFRGTFFQCTTPHLYGDYALL